MASMAEVIREKIAWFWNLDLPKGTRRDLSLGTVAVPALGNRVKVVVGVRRCGKTWRLYQEIAELEALGVDRRSILYFNFDDERLRPYDRLLPSQVMECFYSLNPAAREGAYVFFDEIQDVPDWGVFMRRMVDTERLTCYVTGSSSKMLSQEVATEFRGRATSYELAPFSLREYARHHGAREEALAPGCADRTEQERLTLVALADAFLVEGGYPEAQELSRIEAVDMLQDIAANVVTADVVDRHDFGSSRIARIVASQCLALSARKLSLTKLGNRLRSAGMGLGWQKLEALVGYLEEANLLYRVPDYATSAAENSRRASKVYANDQSLILAVSPSTSVDAGLALETAVYLELRRRQSTARKNWVMSYSVGEGSTSLEVDFVTGDPLLGEPANLIQVCESLGKGATRRRELRALQQAMALSGERVGTIVTRGESETIACDEGTIRVTPAWQWLLGEE